MKINLDRTQLLRPLDEEDVMRPNGFIWVSGVGVITHARAAEAADEWAAEQVAALPLSPLARELLRERLRDEWLSDGPIHPDPAVVSAEEVTAILSPMWVASWANEPHPGNPDIVRTVFKLTPSPRASDPNSSWVRPRVVEGPWDVPLEARLSDTTEKTGPADDGTERWAVHVTISLHPVKRGR